MGASVAADSPQAAGERPVTSREVEELRRELTADNRSNAEAIFEFHNETGDPNNRLDWLRYGGRVNYRMNAGQAFSFAALRTDYRTVDGIRNENGTAFTAGFRTPVAESGVLRFEAGASRLSTDTHTVHALGAFEYNPSADFGLYIRGSRSNVEETLLSATGIRPAAGAFSGRLVGLVMDNRITGGVRYGFLPRWDVFGEGNGGVRTGQNIESNLFRGARAGAGFNAIARPADSELSVLRLSYAFDYLGYDKDLFGFTGAALSNRAGRPAVVGSDGIPIAAAPGRAGTGGYFSPERFTSHTGRIEMKGKANDALEYMLSGFGGVQSYTGIQPRSAYGFSATAIFHLTDRLSLPVSYLYDNLGPFRQQTLLFRLVVGI